MAILTGNHLSRRTFLKGTGAAVALPFLDSMVPAGRLWREVAEASGLNKTRFIGMEMVHGAAGCNDWGATQNLWAPAQVGPNFDLSPTALNSLEPFRDKLTIVSNTDVRMAEAWRPAEIGGDHFRSSAVFLTQAHPRQTEGSDVFVGTSIDQMYANEFGQDTPLPSMQLCIENIDRAGGCAYGYTCVYTDMISWASPTEPLPVIRDPRVAFDMLFGAGGSAEQRAARRRSSSSILDWVAERTAELKRELGAVDRVRLDNHLENVREIERRIQMVEALNSSGEVRELPEAPAGVPDSFEEHVKLMFDLQVLAFQTDMTRVFSFKLGRDASARVYPEAGTERPFHPASHHGDNEEALRHFATINRYHVSLLPYLFDRLRESTDGENDLLEKTAIIYGSPMADGNAHSHRRAPLLLGGKGNGALQGGLHLKAPNGTPMANVFLTLMQEMGMRDLRSFGDSTGGFDLSTGSYTVADR